MSSQALSFILCLNLVAGGFSLYARASDAPPAAESADSGAKKEEKPEWQVVQGRVAALETKIHSSEEEIKKLVGEKAHTKDPKKIQEIIGQMKTLHSEMLVNAREYEQQRALLKYRFPEKDLKNARTYERIEVKSIEDMETQMSLGTSVKRTLKKVRTQYVAPEERARVEKAEQVRETKKDNPPSLTEPVILKK